MAFFYLLAQATQGDAPPSGIEYFLFKNGNFVLLMVLIALVYFFIFRSKQTKDKDRKKMLKEIKRGDEVQTIGGIIGAVVEAREDEVLLKVDETNNTKMRFARSAIHRVLEQKEAKK